METGAETERILLQPLGLKFVLQPIFNGIIIGDKIDNIDIWISVLLYEFTSSIFGHPQTLALSFFGGKMCELSWV